METYLLLATLLVGVAGYLWNCYAAGKWLTWKEWGEFNGD
jgi:hypothetical protein